MDGANSHVAWLMDKVQRLQAERMTCEQRIAEIDRVISAAQVMIEETTRDQGSEHASPSQVGMFAISVPHESKPARVLSRVRPTRPKKIREEKPRQEDWLAQWAKNNDGVIRISEARPHFIADGMTHAAPRNVYGNIMGVMNRSEEFEQIGPGTFRWIPYQRPTTQNDPIEAIGVPVHDAEVQDNSPL